MKTANISADEGKGLFFGYRLCHFFIMMLIFSELGYLLELVYRLFDLHVINSSNHLLPTTFNYGIICFALYATLGTPDEMRLFGIKLFRRGGKFAIAAYVTYFLILALGVAVGELFFGNLYYYLCGYAMWNYNEVPLNVKLFGCQYAFTSLPTTLGFATAGFLFMKFAFKPLMRQVEKIPVKTAVILSAAIGTIVMADYLFALIYMRVYGFPPLYWEINFNQSPVKLFVNGRLFPPLH